MLLGNWTEHLLLRKIRESYHCLRLSTVLRYLEALSPGFHGLGCRRDLIGADEAQITGFYADLLDGRELKNGSYVRKRLEWAHRWARAPGLEEPDWSELPVPGNGAMGSPGVTGEAKYRDLLNFRLRS